MPFISNKKLQALKERSKGFYDGTDNAANEYLLRISQAMRGVKLPPFVSDYSREDIKHAYETIAPVKGVIDYIADNVGEMFRFLYLRRPKKDGDTYEYAPANLKWVEDLIAHPNDRFNARRFGKAWATNRLLFDDAWTYAPKRVGKNRNPKEMYIIPSQRIATQSDAPQIPLEGIKVMGTGDPKTVPLKDNGFESFGYSLDDTQFFGTSNIVAAALYLAVMDKGMRRQDYALDNGGPAGIITPKGDAMGVLPQDADTLEENINGKELSNKIKALRIPIEYTPLGSDPVDLNILAAHKEAVTVLCFLYHLPVDLYYGQSKYENAKEAKKAIYEQQAIPLAEEFGADLIEYLGLSDDGWELVVDRDRIEVLTDRGTMFDNADTMCLSINERRALGGYDKIEEDYCDQPVIPIGVQFGNEGNFDINEGE